MNSLQPSRNAVDRPFMAAQSHGPARRTCPCKRHKPTLAVVDVASHQWQLSANERPSASWCDGSVPRIPGFRTSSSGARVIDGRRADSIGSRSSHGHGYPVAGRLMVPRIGTLTSERQSLPPVAAPTPIRTSAVCRCSLHRLSPAAPSKDWCPTRTAPYSLHRDCRPPQTGRISGSVLKGSSSHRWLPTSSY